MKLARHGFKVAVHNRTPAKMKALFSTHEGEYTPDALRATAQDLGFVAPPPPDVPEEETEAHDRMFRASAGASPTGDAVDDASRIAAMTPDEVIAWAAANGRLEH